jgi:phospholipase/carboxylesterase
MTALSFARAAGAPLSRARGAVILLHGRGATAESMLPLAEVLGQPDLAYIAAQASGRSWYPYSFLAPTEQNEPHLSRSLASIGRLVNELGAEGFGAERVVLLGFSQGGCLALEYAARNAQRFGAVVGLSAGLIGSELVPAAYKDSFAGTHVLLGCSDVDAHIPIERVRETAAMMRSLGADVSAHIYPGMGHTINDDEVRQVRIALARMLDTNAASERRIAS